MWGFRVCVWCGRSRYGVDASSGDRDGGAGVPARAREVPVYRPGRGRGRRRVRPPDGSHQRLRPRWHFSLKKFWRDRGATIVGGARLALNVGAMMGCAPCAVVSTVWTSVDVGVNLRNVNVGGAALAATGCPRAARPGGSRLPAGPGVRPAGFQRQSWCFGAGSAGLAGGGRTARGVSRGSVVGRFGLPARLAAAGKGPRLREEHAEPRSEPPVWPVRRGASVRHVAWRRLAGTLLAAIVAGRRGGTVPRGEVRG